MIIKSGYFSIYFFLLMFFVIRQEAVEVKNIDQLHNRLNFNKKIIALYRMASVFFGIKSLCHLGLYFLTSDFDERAREFHNMNFKLDGLMGFCSTLYINQLTIENYELEKQISDLELLNGCA